MGGKESIDRFRYYSANFLPFLQASLGKKGPVLLFGLLKTLHQCILSSQPYLGIGLGRADRGNRE